MKEVQNMERIDRENYEHAIKNGEHFVKYHGGYTYDEHEDIVDVLDELKSYIGIDVDFDDEHMVESLIEELEEILESWADDKADYEAQRDWEASMWRCWE